ncbi:MAG: hypothetical protein AAF514_24810, partial [Verrucomicrobiota bacterium]
VFNNRCSYMIYSRAFEGLPLAFRHTLFERLDEILSEEGPSDGYEHLGLEEKRRIKKILTETKKELPPSWLS